MPSRPPGAGMSTNSGNVPAVPDTSSFRVVSRAADGTGEPPPITRTSMAALDGRRRTRRRVVASISVAVVVFAVVAAAFFYFTMTGDDSAAAALVRGSAPSGALIALAPPATGAAPAAPTLD